MAVPRRVPPPLSRLPSLSVSATNLLAACLLAACGGGGDAAPSDATAPVNRVPATASAPLAAPPVAGGAPASPGSMTALPAVPAAPAKTRLDVTLDAVDWLEPVVTPAGSARPLVTGRPATLRVRLHASQALPLTVALEVLDADGRRLNPAAAQMNGPATAPTAAQDPIAWGYRYTLPAEWVRPGVRLRIVADPQQRYEDPTPADASRSLTPPVARAQVMRLTVVPLVVAGTTAPLPDDAQVRDALVAAYPLTDVRVRRRAPYVATSVTSPITTVTEAGSEAWSRLLHEVSALRRLEAPAGERYYGFVPKAEPYGVVGIGYVPGQTAIGRAPSSASPHGWRDTLQHEIGHNLDRPHSPCGTEGEGAFPHAGALLGAWGFDRRSGIFLDPSSTRDLMSYCGPSWVSDWTYDQVHAHLARQPLDGLDDTRAAASTVAATGTPQWLVQGRLDQGRVVLQALTPFHGSADPDRGSHRLRLVFADGRSHSQRFQPLSVDHVHGQAQFAVAVPALGAVAAVEVWHGASLVHQQALHRDSTVAPTARAATAVTAHPASTVAQVSEDAQGLTLRWDADRWPRATLTHVGAVRTVLAVNATGGHWRIGRAALPLGDGAFELALTDGVDFALQRLGAAPGMARR